MNRVDILKLKDKAPLYIIGHMHPDVDTIVSSYLLSNILNFFEIESYPCILESDYEIDLYNKRIINDYLDYKPVIIKNCEIHRYNFILVDHNDPIQSLNSGSNVILCIDHHQNTNKINNVIIGNFCANSLFIYQLFKDVYSFNEQERKLIMLAVFTDTLFLKTNRYKSDDEVLVKELNINFDNNKMLEKYFIPTDISMGIDNYIKKSDRDFSYEGINFSSSVIQLLTCDDSVISQYRNSVLTKDDNHLGILRDLQKEKTYAFFKMDDNYREITYNYVASRTTILPEVYNYIKSLSK